MKIEIKIDIEKYKSDVEKLKLDFDMKVKEAILETKVMSTPIVQEEIRKSGLQERTGKLISNWDVKADTSNLELTISTDTEYARIHNSGGWNGRNHASYQRPRFYFDNGMKRIFEDLMERIKAKFKK